MGSSALVVAHPGHELRVFGWMERERPLYFCLTEGSGGAAESRMASTTAILRRVGVSIGAPYGRFSDKDVYRLILEGRTDVFAGMAGEIADALIAAGIDSIAGDAIEGFNPSHDICRFLIDGAVEIVRRRTGRTIRNLEFVLEGRPDDCPDEARGAATWIHLDEAALDRKIEAAMQYEELRGEVAVALERFGRKAFAVECLRPATTARMIEQFDRDLPGYERFGEQRVAEGRYGEVIRYRQHVLPIRAAICAGRNPVHNTHPWNDETSSGQPVRGSRRA